ncbi:TonB family protein [Thermocrinis sp.]
MKKDHISSFSASFTFSSISAFLVFVIFHQISLYTPPPETPQQVVEIVTLPLLSSAEQPEPLKQRQTRRSPEKPQKREVVRTEKREAQKLNKDIKPQEIPPDAIREAPKITESKPMAKDDQEKSAQEPTDQRQKAKEETQTKREREEPLVKREEVQERKAAPPTSEMDRYYAMIKQIIESRKRYPEEARRRGEEGVVIVSFTIEEGGNPTNIRISGSSRSTSLDNETLRLIRSLRFPPPPGGKALSLSVEIEYTLRR